MTAAVVDVAPPAPPQRAPARPRRQAYPAAVTGTLLGQPFIIHTDQPAPGDPLRLLARHLDLQWDVRRRGSDMDRVTHYAGVVVAVSPATVRLAGNVLAAAELVQRAGLEAGRWDVVLDPRRNRVGLDPTAAAIAARLAPATAVDLLVELCLGDGVRTGRVEVGDLARGLQDRVPAWLRRTANDVAAAVGPLSS